MKITNIKLHNIASFREFTFDSQLQKNSLVFGTNGSGKSTIAQLLQLLDKTQTSGDNTQALQFLNEYITKKLSKENFRGDLHELLSCTGHVR